MTRTANAHRTSSSESADESAPNAATLARTDAATDSTAAALLRIASSADSTHRRLMTSRPSHVHRTTRSFLPASSSSSLVGRRLASSPRASIACSVGRDASMWDAFTEYLPKSDLVTLIWNIPFAV